MLVKRVSFVDTGRIELGDVISFTLKTGELVEAMAVQETSSGMLYLTVDCIALATMFTTTDTAGVVDYEHSNLRNVLNTVILERFPDEIRGLMVGMRMKDGGEDLLRIPTEKEIFGSNVIGKDEDGVKQFFGMDDIRNRVAARNGSTYGYWLQNRKRDTAATFAYVSYNGCANYGSASYSLGVRPAFCVS